MGTSNFDNYIIKENEKEVIILYKRKIKDFLSVSLLSLLPLLHVLRSDFSEDGLIKKVVLFTFFFSIMLAPYYFLFRKWFEKIIIASNYVKIRNFSLFLPNWIEIDKTEVDDIKVDNSTNDKYTIFIHSSAGIFKIMSFSKNIDLEVNELVKYLRKHAIIDTPS